MKSPAKVNGKPAGKKAAPKKKAAAKKVASLPLVEPAPKKVLPKKVAAKKAAPKKVVAKKKAPPITAPLPATVETTTSVANAAVLDRLFAVIVERRTANPALSHSARLLSRGMEKVAQKFGEEAVECLIEAVAGHTEAMVAESADVLYHLLVMWVAAGVEPDQVWAELARREGVSGIAEKAARPKPFGTTKIP